MREKKRGLDHPAEVKTAAGRANSRRCLVNQKPSVVRLPHSQNALDSQPNRLPIDTQSFFRQNWANYYRRSPRKTHPRRQSGRHRISQPRHRAATPLHSDPTKPPKCTAEGVARPSNIRRCARDQPPHGPQAQHRDRRRPLPRLAYLSPNQAVTQQAPG